MVFYSIKGWICGRNLLFLHSESRFMITAMNITDIWVAMNSNAESFSEWVQTHPKIGLLFAAGLLALWFTGILLRWKWACELQFHGKLWMFDDCKPETRRRIQIFVVGLALAGFLAMFFVWR